MNLSSLPSSFVRLTTFPKKYSILFRMLLVSADLSGFDRFFINSSYYNDCKKHCDCDRKRFQSADRIAIAKTSYEHYLMGVHFILESVELL